MTLIVSVAAVPSNSGLINVTTKVSIERQINEKIDKLEIYKALCEQEFISLIHLKNSETLSEEDVRMRIKSLIYKYKEMGVDVKPVLQGLV